MTDLEILKLNILERQYPFFEDNELQYYLDKNEGDVRRASYECLIIKAENTGLQVSGMTTKDTSSYFKMLASKYVTTNTGVLS